MCVNEVNRVMFCRQLTKCAAFQIHSVHKFGNHVVQVTRHLAWRMKLISSARRTLEMFNTKRNWLRVQNSLDYLSKIDSGDRRQKAAVKDWELETGVVVSDSTFSNNVRQLVLFSKASIRAFIMWPSFNLILGVVASTFAYLEIVFIQSKLL